MKGEGTRTRAFILLLPSSSHRLDLRQEVAEFAVVDLHAVIEIKADAQIGIVPQFLVEGLQFGLLLQQRVSLLL